MCICFFSRNGSRCDQRSRGLRCLVCYAIGSSKINLVKRRWTTFAQLFAMSGPKHSWKPGGGTQRGSSFANNQWLLFKLCRWKKGPTAVNAADVSFGKWRGSSEAEGLVKKPGGLVNPRKSSPSIIQRLSTLTWPPHCTSGLGIATPSL